MNSYPQRVQALIQALTKLPGIGKRSAERIALHLLKAKPEEVYELSGLIGEVKRDTRFCEFCGNFSTEPRCTICKDERRDPSVVCVVEDPRDITRIESSGRFRGLYHVLFGVISPLEGVGPNELRITELIRRVKNSKVQEVIIAIPANTDGETTTTYLVEHLKPLGARVTRLARGLPFGSSLEFADEETLASAFEFRHLI